MELRRFRVTDTPALIELFRNTVHTVCGRDYSAEHLAVWAPEDIDVEKWSKRFSATYTVIAENKNQILGFANLETYGCIDMLYVAASVQTKGIGTLLYKALENEARSRGLKRIYSDVSLTARLFFKSKGFVIQKEYLKNIADVAFPNAILEKILV